MLTERARLAIMESRRWLSQREAAEYLGFSTRFLSRETAAGRLPVIRAGAGKALRYDRTDLDAYMLRHREERPPPTE